MTDEQFLVIGSLLSESRDLLVEIRDAIASVAAAAAEDESGECQHPEEKRVDMRTPATPEHWICAVCRYEHQGLTHN